MDRQPKWCTISAYAHVYSYRMVRIYRIEEQRVSGRTAVHLVLISFSPYRLASLMAPDSPFFFLPPFKKMCIFIHARRSGRYRNDDDVDDISSLFFALPSFLPFLPLRLATSDRIPYISRTFFFSLFYCYYSSFEDDSRNVGDGQRYAVCNQAQKEEENGRLSCDVLP